MDKLISQQAAIEKLKRNKSLFCKNQVEFQMLSETDKSRVDEIDTCIAELLNLPSAQPTLYGYDIEHLEMIARVLREENLPPERVVEALTDIGRIVAIVKDELEEALRNEIKEIYEVVCDEN